MFLHPCLQMSKIPFLAVTLVVAVDDFLLCHQITYGFATKKYHYIHYPFKVVRRNNYVMEISISNIFTLDIRMTKIFR